MLEVREERFVVVDLLVKDGGGLLVEVRGHVVRVDQALPLVQPLPDLLPSFRPVELSTPSFTIKGIFFSWTHLFSSLSIHVFCFCTCVKSGQIQTCSYSIFCKLKILLPFDDDTQ